MKQYTKKKKKKLTVALLDPDFESCILTLIVSNGWQVHASIKPAAPPATK